MKGTAWALAMAFVEVRVRCNVFKAVSTRPHGQPTVQAAQDAASGAGQTPASLPQKHEADKDAQHNTQKSPCS